MPQSQQVLIDRDALEALVRNERARGSKPGSPLLSRCYAALGVSFLTRNDHGIFIWGERVIQNKWVRVFNRCGDIVELELEYSTPAYEKDSLVRALDDGGLSVTVRYGEGTTISGVF